MNNLVYRVVGTDRKNHNNDYKVYCTSKKQIAKEVKKLLEQFETIEIKKFLNYGIIS